MSIKLKVRNARNAFVVHAQPTGMSALDFFKEIRERGRVQVTPELQIRIATTFEVADDEVAHTDHLFAKMQDNEIGLTRVCIDGVAYTALGFLDKGALVPIALLLDEDMVDRIKLLGDEGDNEQGMGLPGIPQGS